MNPRLDLSMGQRLAIGFGLLLLVFAVVLVLVGDWHRQSAVVQQRYASEVRPLKHQLRELDRSIYRVAVSARSVFIEPNTERLQAFEAAAGEARAAADRLDHASAAVVPLDMRSRLLRAARRYVETAAALVAHRVDAPVTLAEEETMAAQRVAFLSRSDEVGALQQEQANAMMAELEDLRTRTGQGLMTLAILGSLVLLLVAWITARSVSRPVASLLRTVAAMERGDWQPALALAARNGDTRVQRDEMGRLARAFGSAAQALEAREQRLQADSRVARAVSSSLDRESIAQAALDRIVEHAGAELGVLYTCSDGEEELVPIAAHAAAGPLQPLRLGEGIPGQAARARSRVLVDGIPGDAGFSIRLGYDQSPPRCVVAVPVLFAEQLRGVLVLASLRPFGSDALAFLDAAAAQLGIGLQNVQAYERMQDLLARVSESNEKIQAQNEELQVQYEEIQAQNEEIQAQNEEIQAQSEEIQAQNEELMQQREELRSHSEHLVDADERKNAFLGVLAHELRNPMSAIGNGLFVLQRAVTAEGPPRRAVEIIERQSRHLVRLIDDLLDITRISQGKIQVQREPLVLQDVVQSCIEDVSIACQHADIRLELSMPEAPLRMQGDRTRLCQVLGNLLANSIKFGKAGDTVRVQLQADADARHAVLTVDDQGEGIAPDVLNRLFQPFSQGISGLDRGKGGLGLGLALVKALVQLHGGSVQAQSEGRGLGARFTVRLPLGDAERAPAVLHGGAAADARLDGVLPGTRVLVIEDNTDAAHSLEEALRVAGCEVTLARSGPEGVRRATELQPDVVLCDIGLPISDGYQVARDLRARSATADMLLIALTGYASAEDRDKARAAGFDHHIAKPLDIAAFARLLATQRTAEPG